MASYRKGKSFKSRLNINIIRMSRVDNSNKIKIFPEEPKATSYEEKLRE